MPNSENLYNKLHFDRTSIKPKKCFQEPHNHICVYLLECILTHQERAFVVASPVTNNGNTESILGMKGISQVLSFIDSYTRQT